MATRWKNGNDISKLQQAVIRRGEEIKAEGEEAISLSVEDGAILLQDLLEAATTGTGERRVAKGGISAGRHLTGNMVGSIGDNADSLEREDTRTWGRYGWFAAYYEAYFRDQDKGVGNIPAAGAMFASFSQARNQFRARMARVARGRRAGR